MKKRILITALIASLNFAITLPATADSLTSEIGALATNAALSSLGLSEAQVSQANEWIEKIANKGVALMDNYNYDPSAPGEISLEDSNLMKSEMEETVSEAETSLSSLVSGDALSALMEIVKAKIPAGLL